MKKKDKERILNIKLNRQRELEHQRMLHDLFFKRNPKTPIRKGKQ